MQEWILNDYELREYEDVMLLASILFYDDLGKKYKDCSNFRTQYPSVYDDIESDSSKNSFFTNLQKSIKKKEIKSNSGSKEDLFKIQVETLSFFDWAEKMEYKISNVVRKTIGVTKSKLEIEKKVMSFKSDLLSVQDFKELLKEPLWELNAAILQISGYKKTQDFRQDQACIDSDSDLSKIREYAFDSKIKNILRFHAVDKVDPNEFIIWAKTLPIKFPIIEQALNISSIKQIKKPSYITPAMQLMFDAVEHFWKDYDLENPDRNKAPFKPRVVEWLIARAEEKGISDFSDKLAQNIDTIIRCPKSRKGGNRKF